MKTASNFRSLVNEASNFTATLERKGYSEREIVSVMAGVICTIMGMCEEDEDAAFIRKSVEAAMTDAELKRKVIE